MQNNNQQGTANQGNQQGTANQGNMISNLYEYLKQKFLEILGRDQRSLISSSLSQSLTYNQISVPPSTIVTSGQINQGLRDAQITIVK
jgi:hypothetical protein